MFTEDSMKCELKFFYKVERALDFECRHLGFKIRPTSPEWFLGKKFILKGLFPCWETGGVIVMFEWDNVCEVTLKMILQY